MRTGKRLRAKKTAAPKRSARATRFTRSVRRHSSQTLGMRTMLVAGICILGAAMLVAARKPQPSIDTASTRVGGDKALMTAELDGSIPSYVEPKTESTFPKAQPVTITGCLEQNDESFRLKDTAGDEAPRARSWKSGFLKKRTSSIGVIDADRRLKLPAHVGERVSVTGVMMNKEMQARSLHKVGAACSD